MTNRPPGWDIHSEKFFWRFTAVLFTLLVLINYFPVFLGQVPLPGGLVTQFSAWAEFQPRSARPPVADIGDLIDYFYPYHAFSAQQVRAGTIPLWNPYVMSGYPFQAEPQTAMFYPLHAVYYIFSTPTAWALSLIARSWLAGMFMTLLIRSLGGSKTGSVISGMAFSFSGFVVAWQGAAMGDAVIWLPLVCYSVVRLHRDRSAFSLAIAAAAFAMPVLAGHPETAIHVILTGCFAALLIWIFPVGSTRRFDPRFVLSFLAVGVLAFGLASVQLLPTLEWALGSARDLKAVWPSFPLHQGLGFLSRDILRGPNSAGVYVPNAAAYVGMFTILAAAVGILHPARRYMIWFLGLTLFGLAGTFGYEPVRWVLSHTPIIMGLKNDRLILLTDFGLAALAGFGVSVLENRFSEFSNKKRWLGWLLIAVSFLVAFVCIYKLRLASEFRVETLRRPSFSRTMLLAGLVVIVWKLLRQERARLFPIIAGALLAFDLLTYAFGYTSFTPRDEVFPPAPVFDFLRQQGPTASFRFARAGGWPFATNSGIAYGIESVTGFEASVPPALRRFTEDFTEPLDPYVSLIGEKVAGLRDRRIDMLNLKYLVVLVSAPEHAMFLARPERFTEIFKRGDVAVFENKMVLPRAFLVGTSGIQVIPDTGEQLRLLKEPTFDPERTVVLDEKPREFAETAAAASGDFAGRVETIDSDVNGYSFRVEASTASVLVVSQNMYPGWRATVNGSPTSVFPANHALTGIAVPAGNSRVAFVFDPMPFKAGALMSLASALILSGLLIRTRLPVRE